MNFINFIFINHKFYDAKPNFSLGQLKVLHDWRSSLGPLHGSPLKYGPSHSLRLAFSPPPHVILH